MTAKNVVFFTILLPCNTLKGLGHEIEFIYLDKNEQLVLVVNKYLFWFFNFQNASLMRCHHCHFPRGLDENLLENKHLFEKSNECICSLSCFLLVHCVNS
jgi:hypothetical protein